MITVEKCTNWTQISIARGNHCWNCAKRNGYPYRAQPDKGCENFKPSNTVKPLKIDTENIPFPLSVECGNCHTWREFDSHRGVVEKCPQCGDDEYLETRI